MPFTWNILLIKQHRALLLNSSNPFLLKNSNILLAIKIESLSTAKFPAWINSTSAFERCYWKAQSPSGTKKISFSPRWQARAPATSWNTHGSSDKALYYSVNPRKDPTGPLWSGDARGARSPACKIRARWYSYPSYHSRTKPREIQHSCHQSGPVFRVFSVVGYW